MEEQNQYIPGVCNIGRSEIKMRKLAGWVGLVITIILYGSLVYFGVPRIWRLIIFIPSAMAAIGFLQARMHFCANFGMRGIFNFGEIGNKDTVEQAEFRAADRRKAMQIISYSVIAGIAAAVIAYSLPWN
ncbi:MAG: hypothetical protein O8C64_05535 [Candidatus Methanoperedens sp.]|nr:hypothetical protein [Candidatus Methanoperedens sp.]MCZ7406572.1 hypothetical protein [Candidatus Methanoperedens sp.]